MAAATGRPACSKVALGLIRVAGVVAEGVEADEGRAVAADRGGHRAQDGVVGVGLDEGEEGPGEGRGEFHALGAVESCFGARVGDHEPP